MKPPVPLRATRDVATLLGRRRRRWALLALVWRRSARPLRRAATTLVQSGHFFGLTWKLAFDLAPRTTFVVPPAPRLPAAGPAPGRPRREHRLRTVERTRLLRLVEYLYGRLRRGAAPATVASAPFPAHARGQAIVAARPALGAVATAAAAMRPAPAVSTRLPGRRPMLRRQVLPSPIATARRSSAGRSQPPNSAQHRREAAGAPVQTRFGRSPMRGPDLSQAGRATVAASPLAAAQPRGRALQQAAPLAFRSVGPGHVPGRDRATSRRVVERVWASRAAAGATAPTTPPAAPPAVRLVAAEQPSSLSLPRPAAQSTAMPMPDVNRLVDEVMRRLDRVARDERMRRGI